MFVELDTGGIGWVSAGFLAGLDHGVPQPLHVGQQTRARRIADDLPEQVAEQPDVASHRLRQFGPVPVPPTLSVRAHRVRAHSIHTHSIHTHLVHAHGASVIGRCDVPVNLMP